MDFLSEIIDAISGLMWGVPMLVLLLGSHIFLTIRTRFIQRKILLGIRLSISKDKTEKEKHKVSGDVTQFGALMTALCATLGTGNMVGVGSAIALGGPGAIF